MQKPMSPIEQLLISPTWKHRWEESNLSPFKPLKDYDELTNKAKGKKNKKARKK